MLNRTELDRIVVADCNLQTSSAQAVTKCTLHKVVSSCLFASFASLSLYLFVAPLPSAMTLKSCTHSILGLINPCCLDPGAARLQIRTRFSTGLQPTTWKGLQLFLAQSYNVQVKMQDASAWKCKNTFDRSLFGRCSFRCHQLCVVHKLRFTSTKLSQENRDIFCLGFGWMSATNTKLFRFANFQSINFVHLESTKAAAHSSDRNIITSDNLAFNLRVPCRFNVGF